MARPLQDAVLGDVADPAAGGADDAVGEVGLVLALPALVIGRAAVAASAKKIPERHQNGL
jgi:hypothetical protein